MIKPPAPDSNRPARLVGVGFSRSRRRLLATGAALVSGLAGWSWWRWALHRAPVPTAEAIIESACDRLLPAWGNHPGVRALGIDRELSADFRSNHSYLEELVSTLREAHFMSLDDVEKDALLERLINGDTEAESTRAVRRLLRRLASRYYTHPSAWPALGYRQPQPLGFPEYADCETEHAT